MLQIKFLYVSIVEVFDNAKHFRLSACLGKVKILTGSHSHHCFISMKMKIISADMDHTNSSNISTMPDSVKFEQMPTPGNMLLKCV